MVGLKSPVLAALFRRLLNARLNRSSCSLTSMHGLRDTDLISGLITHARPATITFRALAPRSYLKDGWLVERVYRKYHLSQRHGLTRRKWNRTTYNYVPLSLCPG